MSWYFIIFIRNIFNALFKSSSRNYNKKNRVYITSGKYKKNIWEFPGGKVKKHENIVHALKRELLEEVGIIVLNFSLFEYFKCINSKKNIFFLIKKWRGRPYSTEGYSYIWKY